MPNWTSFGRRLQVEKGSLWAMGFFDKFKNSFCSCQDLALNQIIRIKSNHHLETVVMVSKGKLKYRQHL